MEDKHSGHGRSGDAKAHPSLRKLDPEAVDEAKRLFAEGRGPKEVLEVLRRWNESVTAQDVYNLKAKIAREKEGGGKGRVRKAGAGESGAQVIGDVAVDPALQQESGGASNGGPAPAARMQDVAMQDGMGVNEAAPATASGRGGRCECKCCEH